MTGGRRLIELHCRVELCCTQICRVERFLAGNALFHLFFLCHPGIWRETQGSCMSCQGIEVLVVGQYGLCSRGTADVAWTQRWIAARAIRYRLEFHILGLDMSKAFDTINRPKLLEVMSAITNPDSHVSSNIYSTTQLSPLGLQVPQLNRPFESTIGTPQGDSLSPVLYICYLEAALQECRTRLAPRTAGNASLPPETGR